MVSRDSQLKLSTVGPVVDDLFGDRVIHSQRRIILVHACYSSWTLHPWRHGIFFSSFYTKLFSRFCWLDFDFHAPRVSWISLSSAVIFLDL